VALRARTRPEEDHRPEDVVLALTPTPLQTAGERAFFAELARWDTGNGVRAAVVASLPLVEPGPLQRRLSDAVLFVPEGVAVVRVVEVMRQSGVVTARPEGPWAIGTPGGSGSILQLHGGGSTPLDGLMRAGMDVALRLRQADIEPGRIARLTVLVGDLDGLDPADGDLGEGDQVAILEPRSLLLGIARASRYAGVDNPRLWTTADVRAALEALGLEGRGPTVEELNGEGFPYSPYILRMRSLMAPAVMAASRVDAAPAELAPPAAPPAPPAAPPAAVPVPTPAAPPTAPPLPTPVRDTVAIDGPSAPAPAEPDETGGLGGLFAGAEPDEPDGEPESGPDVEPAVVEPAPAPVIRTVQPRVAEPQLRPRTAVFPASSPPTAPPADPPAVPPPAPWVGPTVAPAGTAPAQPAPLAVRPPAEPPRDFLDEPVEDEPHGRRTWLVLAGALVLVALLGVGAFLLFGGGADDDPPATDAGSTSGPIGEQIAGPEPGDVQEVDGETFTAEAVQFDDTCAGHAYGDVAAFLDATNCTALSRALYSTDVDGRPVVVSIARVTMPDAAIARELRALADTNGSGNINDLLREGVGYDGGPDGLSGAEYASAVSGTSVTIVETSWVVPEAGGDSAAIDAVATTALVLATPERVSD
jgi:hypothetical protein